jgi:hypothetical protein
MRSFRSVVLGTGIAGGLLFAIHASFPNVDSWPMIWPALAGATAFWLATREPNRHRLRSGLAAALATGAIIGAITFVGLSIEVYIITHTNLVPSIHQSGVSPALVSSAASLGFAALGAVDVVVALLAGAVMLPVRYFQLRRVHASTDVAHVGAKGIV